MCIRDRNKKAADKKEPEVGAWYFGRRNFLQSTGWLSFFGFFTIMLLGSIRSMFPRVIYENPPIFKAGFPIDYVPGSVSERFKDEERVWIIRQIDGSFIALIAICTHLGCTCLLYTSDAADERSSVDLGGRRIIKKKKKKEKTKKKKMKKKKKKKK